MREMITWGLLARKTFAKMPVVPSELVPLWIIVRGSREPRGMLRTLAMDFVPRIAA